MFAFIQNLRLSLRLHTLKALLLSILLGSMLILSSCSQKSYTPPEPSPNNGYLNVTNLGDKSLDIVIDREFDGGNIQSVQTKLITVTPQQHQFRFERYYRISGNQRKASVEFFHNFSSGEQYDVQFKLQVDDDTYYNTSAEVYGVDEDYPIEENIEGNGGK